LGRHRSRAHRTHADGRDPARRRVQRFDIRRLRALVGELPFDEGYPERVLDRYVPAIAAGLEGVTGADGPSGVEEHHRDGVRLRS
jgi:hypothetical protein